MFTKAAKKGVIYKESTLNPEEVASQIAEIKPEFSESEQEPATTMINTVKKPVEVFGRDAQGKIV